ncbi:hypothetical protein C8039_08910 [Halogeometricum sp. wsp3]|nr:hypothetical protein C8039_08910 [Halogeometricum sp. wsp3]
MRWTARLPARPSVPLCSRSGFFPAVKTSLPTGSDAAGLAERGDSYGIACSRLATASRRH